MSSTESAAHAPCEPLLYPPSHTVSEWSFQKRMAGWAQRVAAGGRLHPANSSNGPSFTPGIRVVISNPDGCA